MRAVRSHPAELGPFVPAAGIRLPSAATAPSALPFAVDAPYFADLSAAKRAHPADDLPADSPPPAGDDATFRLDSPSPWKDTPVRQCGSPARASRG